MIYLDGYNKVLHKFDDVRTNIILSTFLQIQASVSNSSVPDNAKLERAKPPVRMPTTSQWGNPRSREERVIQAAGDKKAIVWQIFRTYMCKTRSSLVSNIKIETM